MSGTALHAVLSNAWCLRPSKKPRMTDGTATGIITAGALKSEMDRKREFERKRFAKLDAATTGRGAETVSWPHC